MPTEIAFFAPNTLPLLSDGHLPRIEQALRLLADPTLPPHFE